MSLVRAPHCPPRPEGRYERVLAICDRESSSTLRGHFSTFAQQLTESHAHSAARRGSRSSRWMLFLASSAEREYRCLRRCSEPLAPCPLTIEPGGSIKKIVSEQIVVDQGLSGHLE